jgi:hypothetical protein
MFTLTLSRAAEPNIIFNLHTNQPESGVPSEARKQEKVDPHGHGTLAHVLGDTLQTVTVRYFNTNTWASEKQVSDYLAGLFPDKRTETYTFQIWSQLVTDPEIECVLTFKDGRQGRLLLWGTAACVRDDMGKWWFVSTFDYFHGKHPEGNRELSHESTK